MAFTPQQSAAIAARARSICVDAGAGSGKTHVLIGRIVRLIEEGTPLDAIAAITFTDKAAAEMKARLRAAFRQRARIDDPEGMSRWRTLERQADAARISTIHGFCTTLLKEHALRAGLDPDFGVLAEGESQLLVRDALRSTLFALLDARDSAALRLASAFPIGRLLDGLRSQISAGAGFQPPSTEPLSLAEAWQKAAREEQIRYLRALALSPRPRWFLRRCRDFSGECTKADDPRQIRLTRLQAAFDAIARGRPAAETEKCARFALEKMSGRANSEHWGSKKRLEEVAEFQDKAVKWLKENVLPPESTAAIEAEAAQLTCDFAEVLGAARAAVSAALRTVNALDFDGLIARALDVLRNDESVRRETAAGISHLLIDEFQDTDGSQLELASLLAECPGGPRLFIVGDAKQSIYYFRGAEVDVFQQARDRAEDVLPLDTNFRSVPGVLAFVDDVFGPSGLLAAVEPEYRGIRPDRPEGAGTPVEFLMPTAGCGGNVEERRRAEAELIAARIAAFCAEDAPPLVHDRGAGNPRRANPGDIAVLFRGMSNIYLYEEALRRAGIPYQLASGRGFFQRQEIVDVLNVIKVVLDPHDGMALFAFLRGPMGGLTDESLLLLAECGGLITAFRGGSFPPQFTQRAELGRARELVARLRADAARPVPEFLHTLLVETGYEAVLLAQHFGIQKVSNLRKLLDVAGEFNRASGNGLRAFAAYLDEVRGAAQREGDATVQPEGAGAATLLTIHKSKGLEYPIVIAADLSSAGGGEKGPSFLRHRRLGMVVCPPDADGGRGDPLLASLIKRRVRLEEEEEQARILYVTLTRARDILVLSGSANTAEGSWMRMLDERFGLAGRADGEVLDGRGWRGRVVRALPAAAGPAAETSLFPVPPMHEFDAAIAPLASAIVPESLSVSSILHQLAGGHDPEEERPAADAPSGESHAALSRGTLVHRYFERWDFAADLPPDPAAVVAEAGLGLGGRARHIAELQDIGARFAQTELFAQLRCDSGLQRETPFTLRAGPALITGTIDLLMSDGTIIDYKTGRWHERRHANYEWQLLLYAAAVRALRGIQPPRALLVYVDENAVREVAAGPEQIALALRQTEEVIGRFTASQAVLH